MRSISFIIIFFAFINFGYSQNDIKCYPKNWWVGMKNTELQIMVHGNKVASSSFSSSYPGFKIKKINKVENPNYVFIDVTVLPSAKPGVAKLNFKEKGVNQSVDFEIKNRRSAENGKSRIQGVTSSDMIYFLMPDRFSNGDTSNDSTPGLQERSYGRSIDKGRHGGDFKGVENHLDYIKELGASTVWMTPVIINDMKNASYHGYAFTDHYTIDPRFGGDEGYHRLIENAHSKGLKIIQDAVYNHVGIDHITVKDMPMKDWLNQWPSYQNTSYKDQVLFDPYASNIDKKIMTDGWFTKEMPDLNQRNPYVAKYLIQHAIWTTENFGIDGWRIDTYSYCDRDFMVACNAALLKEYPQIGIFAETWVHGMVNQAFHAANNLNIPYKSNLPGVTDFQIHFAIEDALSKGDNTNKVEGLYTTLAKDFIYKDPNKNCVFLDNHDMDRFLTSIDHNIDKYKMGINWLLTLRGIPQLYYGTEILMDGSTNPSDAKVRKDFSGGWAEDTENKFISSGRTDAENEAFNYVKTLANYRKQSSAIKTGKLMQYTPQNGVYVYFRYDKNSTVMVVSNDKNKDAVIKTDRFSERTAGFTRIKNIFTNDISPLGEINLKANGSKVFELIR